MTISAQFCPNCGAPLELVGNRCKFCEVPLQVTGGQDDGAGAGPQPMASPAFAEPAGDATAAFRMTVDDVFHINKRGTVLTGRIASGTVRVGDRLRIDGGGKTQEATCTGVEMFRKQLDAASAGDNVGLLVDVGKATIRAGAAVTHA